MKRTLYLLALTTGLAQAAAEDSFQPIIIAATPASVDSGMIRAGIAHTSPDALTCPVGQLYVALNDNPEGINALGQDPLVVDQTNFYSTIIQANQTLQDLAALAVKLAASEAPEAERVMALDAFGFKYAKIVKGLVQRDIPALKLRPTLKATIEKNAAVTLDARQEICFKAAQLAVGGLNLQEQWNIDPKTFAIMFHRYMAVPATSVELEIDKVPVDESNTVEEQPAPATTKSSWFFWR